MIDPFVIYSKKHSRGIAIWWSPNNSGYTNDLKRAGEYTKEQAADICGDRDDSIAIKKKDAESLYLRTLVDMGDASNVQDFQHFTGKQP